MVTKAKKGKEEYVFGQSDIEELNQRIASGEDIDEVIKSISEKGKEQGIHHPRKPHKITPLAPVTKTPEEIKRQKLFEKAHELDVDGEVQRRLYKGEDIEDIVRSIEKRNAEEEEEEEGFYASKSGKTLYFGKPDTDESLAKEAIDGFIKFCRTGNAENIVNYPVEITKGGEHNLCNCVTEALNITVPGLPKGKYTRSRKVFEATLKEFDKRKEKEELTNCTKELVKFVR